jgi:glycosyltransferase involved in cell wall biosynthesis
MLSIVVPVYNEEQTIGRFLAATRDALEPVTDDYEIIFAADPCKDRTIEIIRDENENDPRIKAIVLSRRFGQPSATFAGLSCAAGDAVVVIDCDLQDPPSLIPEMIRLWQSGYKVVIPQRRTRKGETLIKRIVAHLGYRFINHIAEVPIPRNTGDFRLLDRRVVQEILALKEHHGFLRGLTAIVGFKTYLLRFDRDARVDGEGKYNRFTGSLKIGFNGIVAFSDYLLNVMVKFGLTLAFLTLPLTVFLIVIKMNGWFDFSPGIATLFIFILLMSGVHLLGLGILGAYISRIYEEAKNRPKFIVETVIGAPAHTWHSEPDSEVLTSAQSG